MTAEEVRSALMGESARLLERRRVFRRLPSPPRCKLCAAPFAGIGGLVLGHAGFARSPGNPDLCAKCLGGLRKRNLSGVEIPVTLLFSDVRGSTAMAEQMSPTEFHAFLDHFYRLASEAIVGHDGLVDKVVGDEIVALFFGGIERTQPRGSRRRGCDRRGRAGGTRRRYPVRTDSCGNRCPHGRGVRRRDRAGRYDRGLHGARRRRQHHLATRIGGAAGRGARQCRSGRGCRFGDRRAPYGGDSWPGETPRRDNRPSRERDLIRKLLPGSGLLVPTRNGSRIQPNSKAGTSRWTYYTGLADLVPGRAEQF